MSSFIFGGHMKRLKKNSGNFMYRLSEIIVDKRKIIFLVVILGVIFSLFSMGWVEVENDLADFLPEKSDSKAGVDVMMDEFTLYGTATVMVANVSLDKAYELVDLIESVDGVQMVDFANDAAHYNNVSACYTVTFIHEQTSQLCSDALENVEVALNGYDFYISSDIGNPMGAILDNEILMISIVAGIIILSMLAFTSKSIIEVPVILISFLAAMMFNLGTNFIFGKISFVSSSVTSLLQLALSLDYAVIMLNRFREERSHRPLREAVVEALSKSVPEVFGSSLTTVGGMIAMMFMQFKLGPDMAICLVKAILLAMISVFVFMPGLLMLFGNLIMKTEHKSLVPKVPFIGKFAYATRKIVPPIFLIVVIAAAFVSSACPFAYGYFSQESAKLNEQSLARKMISENFGSTNMVAMVVPTGDYDKEAELLRELESYDEVSSTMGLANTVAMDGYTLAEGLNPRQFSELAGLDYELGCVVYAAYAATNADYASLIGNIGNMKVPLIDMFMFLADQIDSGIVSLEGDQADMLAEAKELMGSAKSMLVGENYSRMVVYLNLPEDSDETFAFLEKMEEIAKSYYPDGEVYIVGNSTTAKDFKESFELDNIVVTFVSIFTVMIVLLLSFKSVMMPVILILVIQGAIWINFSIPSLQQTPLFFLGYIIISAIQMGANIDYAIVIATRYNELKHEYEPKQAIIETMNFAFPTVITSGFILSITGLLIGYMSSEATISSLGANLGRGTIVSIILVLFVLPQLLLISDKLVDKTTFTLFKKKVKAKEQTADGRVRIRGNVSGEISGRIEGVIDAVVDGNVLLTLRNGEMTQEKETENEN